MKTVWVVVGLAVAALSGCNQCEKMTESVCKDLGAEDCASWQAIDGPNKVIPGAKRPNKACGAVLDNEAAYKGVVKTARLMILSDKLQKATDNTQRKELSEKIKTLATSN